MVLADNPLAGRPITKTLREYSVPTTPFSVVYRVAEDRIEIMRFWDKRADRGTFGPADEGLQ